MIADLFAVIAPVFLVAAVGYGWAKSGRVFDNQMASTLSNNIGVPCLIIVSLLNAEVSMAALGSMAWASLAVHVITGLLAVGALLLLRQPQSVFLPSLMFSNTGNMGLPLCLFAFGEEGLALGIAYFVVSAIGIFTVGFGVSAGRGSLKELPRNPTIWAVVIAVLMLVFDVSLPRWIDNTLDLLAGLTIPLMLLALGVSLAKLKVNSLGRSLIMATLRLAIGFAVGWGVAEAMGLEGAARGVVILESAMPVAVVVYLFAARYDNRPEEVAATVVVSTALSFLTLPALLLYIMP